MVRGAGGGSAGLTSCASFPEEAATGGGRVREASGLCVRNDTRKMWGVPIKVYM